MVVCMVTVFFPIRNINWLPPQKWSSIVKQKEDYAEKALSSMRKYYEKLSFHAQEMNNVYKDMYKNDVEDPLKVKARICF